MLLRRDNGVEVATISPSCGWSAEVGDACAVAIEWASNSRIVRYFRFEGRMRRAQYMSQI